MPLSSPRRAPHLSTPSSGCCPPSVGCRLPPSWSGSPSPPPFPTLRGNSWWEVFCRNSMLSSSGRRRTGTNIASRSSKGARGQEEGALHAHPACEMELKLLHQRGINQPPFQLATAALTAPCVARGLDPSRKADRDGRRRRGRGRSYGDIWLSCWAGRSETLTSFVKTGRDGTGEH
jgi:hypothetical protein